MCNNLKCKFCGSNRINKRGKQKYNGKQRYLCRKARRQGDESLLSITNEAQSQTETSLLDFGSLSFGKVPKRLKGARVAESPSVCQSVEATDK